MALLNVEIFDAKKPSRSIAVLENPSISVERQQLRLTAAGKGVSDSVVLSSLNLPFEGANLFLRDLGPQIGWQTVFLAEYAGPLLIYPLFYLRPAWLYGEGSSVVTFPVRLALICWSFHYIKRLLETLFVHRFSNATMPLMNIFKNCGYYWGFAAFISYFVNHPAYTPPTLGGFQTFFGLGGFLLAEIGNFSVHLLLRDLRPPGTKERKIPLPNSNALTKLFDYVSCPNYTYEVFAWFSFAVMTQSLPALMFTVAGFVQMAIWAKNKHRNYLKQFPAYPKGRKAIVPFLL
ncbi:unnamed protein product [Enterobius vermicularis]|uniref:very-long-chain enoyl-CoA reductase n=1 Tax=Enterobius vermicularis TaxID=51028 RepID=A0A0N4VKE1_ENTVE|nr:unnamed protein product [Enterobius vermicularis]